MALYAVKKRFWDVARKVYVDPGAAWSPADTEQAVRLQKAGCVVPAAAAPPAPKAPAGIAAPKGGKAPKAGPEGGAPAPEAGRPRAG